MSDLKWAERVFNEHAHMGWLWLIDPGDDEFADAVLRPDPRCTEDSSFILFGEFEAVAIAKELERRAAAESGEPSLAAEVTAAIKQLDELAATWSVPVWFMGCRDRLRKALERDAMVNGEP